MGAERARAAALAVASVLVIALAGCATAPPPDAMVIGTVFSRERLYVPPDEPAVFEAALLDVSRPDAPPTVLGRQRIELPGPPPYQLQIPFRSALTQPLLPGRYRVRASLSLQGYVRFASDGTHPLPPDPAYRRVDVELHRLPLDKATVQAEVPLRQTYWRLVEIDDTAVPPAPAGAPEPHLVLDSEGGRARGAGGCNRFLASYAVDGVRLRMTQINTTLQLCLQTATLEGRFLQALDEVRTYRQEGRQLLLFGEEARVLLRLEATELE